MVYGKGEIPISHMKKDIIEKNLKEFLELTECSLSDLSDISQTSIRNSSDILKVDIENSVKISEYFNISIKGLLCGAYCKETLQKQASGNTCFLSESAQGNSGTTVKTIKNIFKYHDPHVVKSFLLEHQIHEDYLKNDNNKLSFSIFAKLLDITYKNYKNILITEHVGESNARRHYTGLSPFLGRKNKGSKTLELLTLNSQLVEKNLEYSVAFLKSDSIGIRAKTSNEAYKLVRGLDNCSEIILGNVKGFINGIATTSGFRPKSIKYNSCNNRSAVFEVCF